MPSEDIVNGKNLSPPRPVTSPKKFIKRKSNTKYPKPDKEPFISSRLSLIFEATQMDK
jgi:hypothetical protein